jgi:hypothetical protein
MVPPVARSVRARLLRWLAAGPIGYSLIIGLLMIFEEFFIFVPSRYPAGDWHPAGLDFQDVEFRAEDGVRLHGWYCPSPADRAVVLVSHGNAGNVSHRAEEIRLWQRQLRASVFIYDYRGYGRSEGSPNEKGLYADARAAYRWLTGEQHVAADRVVLRGESIGAAVALQLALEVPHGALILESPFTSAVEMGRRQFPWVPVRWLLRNRFESDAKINQYRGRLLVTHGTHDSIVPFEMGRRLFEIAPEPKTFQAVEQADHNDVPWVGGAAYFRAIDDFLQSAGL